VGWTEEQTERVKDGGCYGRTVLKKRRLSANKQIRSKIGFLRI
jgi:hypothetical protein